ncbi:ribose-phosphate diphosphokinase [Actinomarinicola tropica]|uniref:Ribose-phosphate pyrophosphokinase n=1 Tax=Actinomarinicola tropica TaxID=2789776 RepID=A0A5Q2RPG9_9ACTN|nr:ribose-phosphate diphosphokinase [Actinomarinicola tropica]QGG96007.1 ribose-phosphate diphosphokinase [Actinomarinicola tropica]
MELVTKKKLALIAGRANFELAEEVAEQLGVPLVDSNCSEFANGELHCKLGMSVRGSDVFIIQSHTATDEMSVNDAIMEHLIMVDAARRGSAKRITVVMPFYGYGRQDRKSEGREPITARLVADMFGAAGAQRLMSVDLHSGQIQGFFNGPVDHLVAMPVLVDYMRGLGDDLVVVSPDAGRVKVAERYSNMLHADLAIIHKRRLKGEKNQVEARDVIGDVAGRTCVLIDDMIDTAGTIVAAAEQLAEKGASRILAAATHGVFSGPAIDRLKNSPIEKIVVTNTLPLPPEKQLDKIEVLSVANIIADAIDAVFEDTSVSEIFGGQNQS